MARISALEVTVYVDPDTEEITYFHSVEGTTCIIKKPQDVIDLISVEDTIYNPITGKYYYYPRDEQSDEMYRFVNSLEAEQARELSPHIQVFNYPYSNKKSDIKHIATIPVKIEHKLTEIHPTLIDFNAPKNIHK